MLVLLFRNFRQRSLVSTGLRALRRRKLSQSHPHPSYDAVDLSFTEVIPESRNTNGGPLIILHGLFGSKRNWGSFLKAFQRDLPSRPLYALDLRNHGTSPQATPMTYDAMARDVHKFVEDRKLKDIALLGHSMGGKVAMAYALSRPEKVSRLIVADIAPSIGNLSADFIRYISTMQEIESLPVGKINTRSDADKILASHEPDISIRQFLLTNLHVPNRSRIGPQHDAAHDKPRFVVPLGILSQSMSALGSFPYEYNQEDGTVPVKWEGPTLAIKGRKSAYLNHKNIPLLRAFFPDVRIEELDAGHWVHAEKPTEFRRLVVDMLRC